MRNPALGLMFALACICWGSISGTSSFAQEEATVAEITKASEKMSASFSAGKADEVAAHFLPNGELIDEQGIVYRGHQEVKDLLSAFFAKFPGSRLENEIDSIRLVGPVAIQEGTHVTTTKEGVTARIRYICVLSNTEQGWRIVSLRDLADETPATPGELLQPLAWLIGDWINEGADARVKIAYRWSEDKNYILGDILVTKNDQVVMKSSQRIGWDSILGKPRSWMFDSDGGFAEGIWTQVDEAWVVRSSAVLPEGLIGSALLELTLGENGRYTIVGTNRLIGDVVEDDYEISVVKQPPQPASNANVTQGPR